MLRQIGELSKGYRSSTYGKAAQQEYGASLPARGDDFEQPPLVVGGERHFIAILSVFAAGTDRSYAWFLASSPTPCRWRGRACEAVGPPNWTSGRNCDGNQARQLGLSPTRSGGNHEARHHMRGGSRIGVFICSPSQGVHQGRYRWRGGRPHGGTRQGWCCGWLRNWSS